MKPLKRSTVAILGLGQIGGSVGRDLVGRKVVAEIIGYDHDQRALRKARRLAAISRSTSLLSRAMDQADIVIICLPIRVTLRLLPQILNLARPNQVVVDLTSTKQVVFERLQSMNPGLNYVSAHPLAGNEGVGIDASEIDMFDSMPLVLLPHPACRAGWIKRVAYLFRRIGARTFSMSPDRHDRLTSLSIQTPYFLAYLLSRMAVRQSSKDRAFWEVTGGSIRGATRVMRSSSELTLDMLLTNRDNIIERIDELSKEMQSLRSLLADNDPAELARQLRATRKQLLKQSGP